MEHNIAIKTPRVLIMMRKDGSPVNGSVVECSKFDLDAYHTAIKSLYDDDYDYFVVQVVKYKNSEIF